MSHIKDRLTDYYNQMKKLAEQHEMITARDVLDMIEQLQDDLKLDENENDWRFQSKRNRQSRARMLLYCLKALSRQLVDMK